MKTKRTKTKAAELEAQLHRLNQLVRARRDQLARLEHCPHTDCECRQVWKEVVEQKLTDQLGKIGQQVRGKNGKAARSKIRRPKAR